MELKSNVERKSYLGNLQILGTRAPVHFVTRFGISPGPDELLEIIITVVACWDTVLHSVTSKPFHSLEPSQPTGAPGVSLSQRLRGAIGAGVDIALSWDRGGVEGPLDASFPGG